MPGMVNCDSVVDSWYLFRSKSSSPPCCPRTLVLVILSIRGRTASCSPSVGHENVSDELELESNREKILGEHSLDLLTFLTGILFLT